MTIGSSKGAFYNDEFHEVAADWIKPEDTDDSMVVTPQQQQQNKQLEQQDYSVMDGIEVSMKKSGKYIGDLGLDDDLSWDETVPIGRRNDKGVVERFKNPEDIMKNQPEGTEGYTLPDNPFLWLRKTKPSKLEDLVS